jgi:chemotaxis protein methyltransferase CheR
LFDIIFIRNVLIYFDTATKKDVLERMTRQLAPGGCIMLGGTENTLGVTDLIAREQGCPAPVYRVTANATRDRMVSAA